VNRYSASVSLLMEALENRAEYSFLAAASRTLGRHRAGEAGTGEGVDQGMDFQIDPPVSSSSDSAYIGVRGEGKAVGVHRGALRT
jgi:hypothetical protein